MIAVSKLFRAYGLYNSIQESAEKNYGSTFQSSFELTGYITKISNIAKDAVFNVSKLFRAYGLYNENKKYYYKHISDEFQSSFELTGYITEEEKSR